MQRSRKLQCFVDLKLVLCAFYFIFLWGGSNWISTTLKGRWYFHYFFNILQYLPSTLFHDFSCLLYFHSKNFSVDSKVCSKKMQGGFRGCHLYLKYLTEQKYPSTERDFYSYNGNERLKDAFPWRCFVGAVCWEEPVIVSYRKSRTQIPAVAKQMCSRAENRANGGKLGYCAGDGVARKVHPMLCVSARTPLDAPCKSIKYLCCHPEHAQTSSDSNKLAAPVETSVLAAYCALTLTECAAARQAISFLKWRRHFIHRCIGVFISIWLKNAQGRSFPVKISLCNMNILFALL